MGNLGTDSAAQPSVIIIWNIKLQIKCPVVYEVKQQRSY